MKTRSLDAGQVRQIAATGALLVGASLLLLGLRKRRISRRFDWQRRVLVIGGSRGLGLILAKEFLTRGARVVIAARDLDELSKARQSLLRELGNAPDDLHTVRCDVENIVEVERAVEQAREHLGGIDVLVNVAGLIQVGPLESMTLEDFEQAMRVHFRGPLVSVLCVLDEMRARRWGRIVNISSIGGLVSIPHLLPYTASKFALTGLSLGLRVELAKQGILVTTVCPGLMRTGSSYRASFKSQHRDEHTWFALGAATPLTSMSAERAARRILAAIELGEPFLVLSWQARLLAFVHALLPSLLSRVMVDVNRFLPRYGGIGKNAEIGAASTSSWVPSKVTCLIDRAAVDWGEVGPPALGK